jgi:hypothetical protein
MRRLLALTIVAVAAAPIASGCGSSSSSDQLSTALSYMPKNSSVVVAINTNLDSDQAKQVGNLIKKVPQGSVALQRLQQSVTSGSGLDFNNDIKPLLGNDLVVSIPTAQALNQPNSPTIEAIKVKDAGKAKTAISKNATKVGTSHGADIYRDKTGGNLTAVDGDTIVGADTRALLDQALANHDGDHMSKDDFNSALDGLDQSSIVRGTADLQSIIASSPGSAQARKIKYVSALRDLGFTLAAKSNSVAVNFQTKTEGLSDSDLPIASGTSSAPVIKRPAEVNLGIRDPQQIYNFVISSLQAANPQQFGQLTAGKQQIGRKLGVDIDKDIVGQLTGNSALSVAADSKGDFAARADLKDPTAFKASLAKVAKGLPALAKQFGGDPIGVSIPKGGNGFYALANGKTGKKIVFAVVKNSFVVASDPARAAQFAVQSPSAVSGVQGAVALDIDAKSLVDQQLRKQGLPPAILGFTSFLGDLTGYLRADTAQTRGNLTLQVK